MNQIITLCLNCAYFVSCNKASEEIRECKEFKKISYETKLVKVDRLNFKFEEVK